MSPGLRARFSYWYRLPPYFIRYHIYIESSASSLRSRCRPVQTTCLMSDGRQGDPQRLLQQASDEISTADSCGFANRLDGGFHALSRKPVVHVLAKNGHRGRAVDVIGHRRIWRPAVWLLNLPCIGR